jgi:hypothetical protein
MYIGLIGDFVVIVHKLELFNNLISREGSL